MASEQADKGGMESGEDFFSIELPAPEGWTKKFFPKRNGTPRRNEIVFISPTGEEIKNKKHLDQYLKSHTGSPASSEFDWGTGDTPRRSARIGSKIKATESPQSGSPQKRQRKSTGKKPVISEDDNNTDGEGKPTHKDEQVAPATDDEEKPKDSTEVEMQDKEYKNKAEDDKNVPPDTNTADESNQKLEEQAGETTTNKVEGHVGDGKLSERKKEVSDRNKMEEEKGNPNKGVLDFENLPKEKGTLKVDNGVDAIKKLVDFRAQEETPMTASIEATAEEKGDVKEAISNDSDAKAEKHLVQENLDEKELPVEKALEGEVGADADRAEENKEAAKTENHSSTATGLEEAPPEPDAPPVTC